MDLLIKIIELIYLQSKIIKVMNKIKQINLILIKINNKYFNHLINHMNIKKYKIINYHKKIYNQNNISRLLNNRLINRLQIKDIVNRFNRCNNK